VTGQLLVVAAVPLLVGLGCTAMTLSVPLIVETGLGVNWDEAH